MRPLDVDHRLDMTAKRPLAAVQLRDNRSRNFHTFRFWYLNCVKGRVWSCFVMRLTASSKLAMNARMGYAGGKGRLWQDIVSLMPPHDTYIETHLGGGAIMRNKRPARASIGVDIDPHVIRAASAWNVPELMLQNVDALAFLAGYAFEGRELIYADPPYVAATKKNRRYYRHEYTDEDHCRLLDALLKLNCRVMISGYPSALYEQALRGWEVKELVNVSHAGLRREKIWANFEFSPDLHDYAPIGGSFRERERIRRKTSRWVHKLARLPDLERRAVLAALIQSSAIEPSFAERLLADRERGVAA